MKDLIKLRDGRGGYAAQWLDDQYNPRAPFRFVEDDRRSTLMETGHFRFVEGDRLSASLDGETEDVVELIDSGECDDILDYLLYAERHHAGRSRVMTAIVARSDVLGDDEDDPSDGPSVAATDIATAR